MRVLAVAFVMATAALSAGPDPAAFNLWRSSQLHVLEQKLSREVDAQKVASERLGSYGNHNLGIAHREGTGNAELHETQNDVFVVLSGEATLVVGGTLERFSNYCGLIKIARSGFPWEKTTRRAVASVYTNC